MTFDDACNHIAEHLPEGWSIRIDLEKNAGCVYLVDPDGNDRDYPSNHEHLQESLLDALAYAEHPEAF